jgi:predicted nucleic acid-binding protein
MLVLDTNVVISAFINPDGKPSQILKMVLGRRAELCINAAIISEYESVMLRPKFSGKIDCTRRVHTPPFRALKKGMYPETNTLPKQHTSPFLQGEVVDSANVRRFINLIRSIGTSYNPSPSKIKLPDESDRIFYDTAKGSGSILISGNIQHFPKERFILLPAEFLKKFENRSY